nr:DUF4143 domain-containing protein [Prosthecochloris sp. GSB1]
MLNHSLSAGYRLSYWRHGNREVDFILVHKNKVIGLEVKSGFTRCTSCIEAFKQRYNPEKVLLVGNSGIPWQELLAIDPAELFL